MDYRYGQFDGHPFVSPDDLFPPQQVVQFVLQYGQDALDSLENHEDDQIAELIDQMVEAGLMERDEQTGKLRLTPKMLRGIEHKALLEMFEGLKQGTRDGHETTQRGRGDERGDGTKPYAFGDPLSEIDLGATMRNAMSHHHRDEKSALPLRIDPGDIELHVTDSRADVATCVLLDLSGSMMRWGRFYQAKRVALGLAALVRQQFPLDTIDFVGFYSMAEQLREDQLPLVMPKPISIREWEVRLRVPLAQAQADPDRVPLHFTNLHMGLRLARQILSRRGAANKQIFVITDGQPTAHLETAEGGEEWLYLLYPPTERTTNITLQEALRCRQQGIRIASFALIEDYEGMDWVSFVTQLTRLTRGMAYYCTSDDLSSTVIESFLSGRRKKSFIG